MDRQYEVLSIVSCLSEFSSHNMVPLVSQIMVHMLYNFQRNASYSIGMRRLLLKGRASIDPAALVHHVPLGVDTWKVWVDVPLEPQTPLWRETSEACTIQQAVLTTVAWHKDFVVVD